MSGTAEATQKDQQKRTNTVETTIEAVFFYYLIHIYAIAVGIALNKQTLLT